MSPIFKVGDALVRIDKTDDSAKIIEINHTTSHYRLQYQECAIWLSFRSVETIYELKRIPIKHGWIRPPNNWRSNETI